MIQDKIWKCDKCGFEGKVWLYRKGNYLCGECYCPPMEKLNIEEFMYKKEPLIPYEINRVPPHFIP